MDCDVLVVGAGFAGLVVAERLVARGGLSVVVIDRRDHVGGNAFDFRTKRGNWVHKYGPHYFRTDSRRVVRYLDRFTEWRPCRYRVLSYADGRYWSFPVNLRTFEQMVGREATEEEFAGWLDSVRVPVDRPRNSEEVVLSRVGRELYERFFLGYTMKHWKRHPRELPPSVCARIPVRTSRDDRYVRESFQAIPARGYAALFERLIESCGRRLEVRLGEEFRPGAISGRHVVYTGPLDEYFDRCHGPLPWRSLEFEVREFLGDELRAREPVSGSAGFWQPALQVNYPNDFEFTRTVELRHVLGGGEDSTAVAFEYAREWGPGADPCYPVPGRESDRLRGLYREMASRLPAVTFIGRLATYSYCNMDEVVESGLDVAERILAKLG